METNDKNPDMSRLPDSDCAEPGMPEDSPASPTKRQRRLGILLSTCLVLTFAPFFLAVALTGERELNEFTQRDWVYFGTLIPLSGMALIGVVVIAVLCVRNNPQRAVRSERVRRARSLLLTIAATLAPLPFVILAVSLRERLPGTLRPLFAVLCFLFYGSALALVVMMLISVRRARSRFRSMNAQEIQSYLLSHLEDAERTSREKRDALTRIRKNTCRLAWAYALCGVLGMTALVQAATPESLAAITVGVLLTFALTFTAFSRVRFPMPKSVLDEDDAYVPEAEWPQLYAAVRRAAEQQGVCCPIRVALLPDEGVGIGRFGDTVSVQLGVTALSVCGERELDAILLHEFAHIANTTPQSAALRQYADWLQVGGNPILTRIFGFAYWALDAQFAMEWVLYGYASAVLSEQAADRAMSGCGDTEIAASALTKLAYGNLFEWESQGADFTPVFAEEEMPEHPLREEIDRLLAAIPVRRAAWNDLIDREIQARSATHPTTRSRLDALGVSGHPTPEVTDTAAWRAECDRAVAFAERRLRGMYPAGQYRAQRETRYLAPKADVETWEAAGEPLNPAEYGDILDALRAIGRVHEAEEVCGRVIAELSENAAAGAYFTRGTIRLHRWDPDGIADVYRAMAANTNYVEEGLEVIGSFCCLTGRQEELDTYRTRALALAQRHMDVERHRNVLERGDTLSEEHLPEEALAGILACCREAGDAVEAVYVVRKHITETEWVTPVVVKFRGGARHGAPGVRRAEVMHRFFRYLDTTDFDWEFSLFDYDSVRHVGVEHIPGSCLYRYEPEGNGASGQP